MQEIFFALLNGGELHIVPDEAKKSVTQLVEFIASHHINVLMLPTSLLDLFSCEAISIQLRLPLLSTVIVAGEALKITENIRKFFSLNAHIALINHYGPTESHVVSSFHLANQAKDWPNMPSIGKPIDNCQLYVLDSHLRPLPCAIPGELYIAGKVWQRVY